MEGCYEREAALRHTVALRKFRYAKFEMQRRN